MSRILLLCAFTAGAFAAAFALTKFLNRDSPAGGAQNKPSDGPSLECENSVPPSPHQFGMVWIPGGEFTMGSDDPTVSHAERPAHRVRVSGFWIDETDVTNAQFRRFVEATGYVTTAESVPTLEEIMRYATPGAKLPKKEDLVAASITFLPPDHPVNLADISQWWKWTPGANWEKKEGRESF